MLHVRICELCPLTSCVYWVVTLPQLQLSPNTVSNRMVASPEGTEVLLEEEARVAVNLGLGDEGLPLGILERGSFGRMGSAWGRQ